MSTFESMSPLIEGNVHAQMESTHPAALVSDSNNLDVQTITGAD